MQSCGCAVKANAPTVAVTLHGGSLWLECFVVSSRVYLMHSFQIASDPMDRRLIRFNNTLQLLACLCNVIGLPGSDIIDCIADLVTATMMGCISAQLSVETKLLESQGFKAPGAPEEIEMKR